MEGFMKKKGHNYKNWKRRYMLFNAQTREMSYYDKEVMTKLKGRFKVNAVFNIPDRLNARPFRIDFMASDGTITATSAESMDMKLKWLETVGECSVERHSSRDPEFLCITHLQSCTCFVPPPTQSLGQTIGGISDIDAHPRKNALEAKSKSGQTDISQEWSSANRFGSELGGGGHGLSSPGKGMASKIHEKKQLDLLAILKSSAIDLKQIAVFQALFRGMVARRRYGFVSFEATRLVVKQMRAFADVLFQGLRVVEFPDVDGGEAGADGAMQRVLFLRGDGSLTLATYALANEAGRGIPLHLLEVIETGASAGVFQKEANLARVKGKEGQCLTLGGVRRSGADDLTLHLLLPTAKVCKIVALKLRMLVTSLRRLGGDQDADADEEARRLLSAEFAKTGQLPATKTLCSVLGMSKEKTHGSRETSRRFSVEGVKAVPAAKKAAAGAKQSKKRMSKLSTKKVKKHNIKVEDSEAFTL
jgi:hypothetical protein